jgi:hypothetical protein
MKILIKNEDGKPTTQKENVAVKAQMPEVLRGSLTRR